MPVRKALVIIGGQTQELPSGDSLFGVNIINEALIFNNILSPSALVGTVNNYTTAGLTNANIIRLVTNGSDVIFTGIDSTGIVNGQLLQITNVDSTKKITLQDENAGSLAKNRLSINGNIPLLANLGITLWYDATSLRWRKLTN